MKKKKEIDKEPIIICERCNKNKAVRYIGSDYVCSNCYYEIKYPKKKKSKKGDDKFLLILGIPLIVVELTCTIFTIFLINKL